MSQPDKWRKQNLLPTWLAKRGEVGNMAPSHFSRRWSSRPERWPPGGRPPALAGKGPSRKGRWFRLPLVRVGGAKNKQAQASPNREPRSPRGRVAGSLRAFLVLRTNKGKGSHKGSDLAVASNSKA